MAGSNTIRNDLIRNFVRQTGIDEKSQDIRLISEFVEEIWIVTPVLTEDITLVFLKTKVPEPVFCRKLTELTGIRHSSVKNGNRSEYSLVLPQSSCFPGVAPKERTIVFTFLENRIALFAKDSLAGYRNCKPYGLPQSKRRFFTGKKSLAAGFFEPDQNFLLENPFFPPVRLAFYSLEPMPGGALRIRAGAVCPDDQSAVQVQMQLQQYVMVGGLLLNQSAPDLTQEWMSMFQIRQQQTSVSLDANISAAFIARLAEVSENIAGKKPGPADPPGKEVRN